MKKILFIFSLLVVALFYALSSGTSLALVDSGHCTCSGLTESLCDQTSSCFWIPDGGGGGIAEDGVCGGANTTYAYDATDYVMISPGYPYYCQSGVTSATPAFPDADSSSNWVCLGQFMGVDSGTCTAYHEPQIDEPGTGGISVTSMYLNTPVLASWQISGPEALTGDNIPEYTYSNKPIGNYSIVVTGGPTGYTSTVNSGPLTLTADQIITFNIVWTYTGGGGDGDTPTPTPTLTPTPTPTPAPPALPDTQSKLETEWKDYDAASSFTMSVDIDSASAEAASMLT